MDYFYAEGVVNEVRAPGQYGQEILIDIGTLDKPNAVMFEAYVDKETGKSFLPHGIAKDWRVKFKFKPRTIMGMSQKTGREYCFTKVAIRDVEKIDDAVCGTDAAKRQASEQKKIDSATQPDLPNGGIYDTNEDDMPF